MWGTFYLPWSTDRQKTSLDASSTLRSRHGTAHMTCKIILYVSLNHSVKTSQWMIWMTQNDMNHLEPSNGKYVNIQFLKRDGAVTFYFCLQGATTAYEKPYVNKSIQLQLKNFLKRNSFSYLSKDVHHNHPALIFSASLKWTKWSQ